MKNEKFSFNASIIFHFMFIWYKLRSIMIEALKIIFAHEIEIFGRFPLSHTEWMKIDIN